MRIKFLQLKAMLFGGDVVYLKIVSDKNQLYAAIACVQWDPFDQDTRPVIHVDHCNFYLDPDGTLVQCTINQRILIKIVKIVKIFGNMLVKIAK